MVFDFLKKKKIIKKAEDRKTEKPTEGPREKIPGLAYKILKSPHVSEKAGDLANSNQYIFKVWPRSNKVEIKRSVEGLYGVDVLSVKIINIPSKQMHLGRKIGWKTGFKKAIVKIKKGQKIELLPR